MTRYLSIFFTLLLLTSCQLEEMWDDVKDESKETFTIEEAREFFENDYSGKVTKTSGGQAGGFTMGDFTPLWDKVVGTRSGRHAAYDVEIIADYRIFAIKAEFGSNGAKAERMQVTQKLVVMKNTGSGRMTSCIMTLIPDVGQDKRKDIEGFHSLKRDGNFSGTVVYSSVIDGALIRVQKFKSGKKIDGVHIPYGKGTYLDRCRKAKELIGQTCLIKGKSIVTKSGEDSWDDYWYDDYYDDSSEGDLWDEDEFEYLGHGIYIDDDGNYYLDIDENGEIDCETIAPGKIEEDQGNDDNSPWPEEDEMPETDGMPGSSPDENENGYNPDDDYWTEDDGTTNDENGDYDSTEEEVLYSKAQRIENHLGDAIKNIKVGLTIKVTDNTLLGQVTPLTTGDLWKKSPHYVIEIQSGLTETQMELVLSHEYRHLQLFEISQNAGSQGELAKTNQELLLILNQYYAADSDGNWLNDGHHEYMGRHVDEMEELLRESFPGRDEEFYEYGKWSGGAFNSKAFNNLNKEDQNRIYSYLRELGLLF